MNYNSDETEKPSLTHEKYFSSQELINCKSVEGKREALPKLDESYKVLGEVPIEEASKEQVDQVYKEALEEALYILNEAEYVMVKWEKMKAKKHLIELGNSKKPPEIIKKEFKREHRDEIFHKFYSRLNFDHPIEMVSILESDKGPFSKHYI